MRSININTNCQRNFAFNFNISFFIVFLFMLSCIYATNYCNYLNGASSNSTLTESCGVQTTKVLSKTQLCDNILNTNSYCNAGPFQINLHFNETINFASNDLSFISLDCANYGFKKYKIYTNDSGIKTFITSVNDGSYTCKKFGVGLGNQSLLYSEFSGQNLIIEIETTNASQNLGFGAKFYCGFTELSQQNLYYIGNNTLPTFNVLYNNTIPTSNQTTYNFKFNINASDLEGDQIYYATYLSNQTDKNKSFFEDWMIYVDGTFYNDYAAMERPEIITNLTYPSNTLYNTLGGGQLFFSELNEIKHGLLFKSNSANIPFYINKGFANTIKEYLDIQVAEDSPQSDFNYTTFDATGNQIDNINVLINSTSVRLIKNNAIVYDKLKNIFVSNRAFFSFNITYDFVNHNATYTYYDFVNNVISVSSLSQNNYNYLRIVNNQNSQFHLITIADSNEVGTENSFSFTTEKPNNITIASNVDYNFYIYVSDAIHVFNNLYNYKQIKVRFVDGKYYLKDILNTDNVNNLQGFQAVVYVLQFPSRLAKDFGVYDQINISLYLLLPFAMFIYFLMKFFETHTVDIQSPFIYGGILSVLFLFTGMFSIIQGISYIVPSLIFIAINFKNHSEGNVQGGV